MSPELQAELIRRYPKFFRKPGVRLPELEPTDATGFLLLDLGPFDERGIECGDGWFAIVDRLCIACKYETAVLILQGVDKKYLPRVAQIKQKMGGLRFYVMGLISDQLRSQILQAEDDEGESYRTCERCGAAGKLRDGNGKHTMKPRVATELVLDALTMAVWRRRPKAEVIIHSDQGSPVCQR